MSSGPTDAYKTLRRSIVEGRLRPGDRLVEQRLAEELELSRTPIREALRMLQSEGLVDVEPNRGARVRTLSLDDINDLYELRARLEAMAAELAAERASESQREALRAAEERFAEAVDQFGDEEVASIRGVFAANEVFHGCILEAARHEQLRQTVIRTVDHTLVFQAFRHYEAENMIRSIEFHRLITESICQGEGARAGRLSLEHVFQGRDQLVEVIGQQGSIDALYGDPTALLRSSNGR